MRLRLRSLLIIVLMAGSLAGYVLRTWYGPGFAFQHRHAQLADDIDFKARFDRQLIARASPHVAVGHRCPLCAICEGKLPARVAEARCRLARQEAEIRHHRFWAGPVGWRPLGLGLISLTVNGGRGPCW